MDLPDSIGAIGEQLACGSTVTPLPELFEAHDVFTAELAHIFVRPWLAVDHVSRLGADGDYFRFEVGSRSVVVARENGETIHALRNACLHAGYRVCEEEDGHGDRLLCRYHDWEYALDGLLTEPRLRPEQTDRSRYRLPRYAVRVCGGLILVDLSTSAPIPPDAPAPSALIADFAESVVTRRQRYSTTWNWKPLRQFLWSSPELFFDGRPAADDTIVEFGPLSRLILRSSNDAALVRIIPRFPGHTDFQLIRLAPAGLPAPTSDHADIIAEALRRAGDAIATAPHGALDDGFFAWYWSMMPPPTGRPPG